MPYVHRRLARASPDARSRGTLARTSATFRSDVAATIMVGVLHGLHAAHEARSERGAPLHLVHRDVSPQNVLVGADGVTRVIDFGVAKAVGRARVTRDATIRGKIAIHGARAAPGRGTSTGGADVYAAGSSSGAARAHTGQQLFAADSDAATLTRVLHHRPAAPERDRRARARGARRGGDAGDRAHAVSPLRHRKGDGDRDRARHLAGELRARGRVGRRARQRRPSPRARQPIVRIEGLRDDPGSYADTVRAAAPVVSGPPVSISSERTWSRRALAVVLLAACLTGGGAFAKFRPGAAADSVEAFPAAPALPSVAPAPEPPALAPEPSAKVVVPPAGEAAAPPDPSAAARARKPATIHPRAGEPQRRPRGLPVNEAIRVILRSAMSLRLLASSLVASAASLAAASPALAQPRTRADSAQASALFEEGRRALAAKDETRACAAFEESLVLEVKVGTLLNRGAVRGASRRARASSRPPPPGDRPRPGTERSALGYLEKHLSALDARAPAADREAVARGARDDDGSP